MTSLDAALQLLLVRDRSLARGPSEFPFLYRRSELLVGRSQLGSAESELRGLIRGVRNLDHLGLSRLYLQAGVDAIQAGARVRVRTSIVHVFPLIHAMANPASGRVGAEEFSADLRDLLGSAADLAGAGATAGPSSRFGGQQRLGRRQLEECLDEVQIAELFAHFSAAARDSRSGEPVLLLPYAGWTADYRTPWAFEAAAHTGSAAFWVAPAGDLSSRHPVYPAADRRVLAVAATDPALDALAATSCWGPWVDVAAPGGAGDHAGTGWAAATAATYLGSLRPADADDARQSLAERFAVLDGQTVVRVEKASDDFAATCSRDTRELRRLLRQRTLTRARHEEKAPGPKRFSVPTRGADREQPPPNDDPSQVSDSGDGGQHWMVSTQLLNAAGTALGPDECLRTETEYSIRLHVGQVPALVLETRPAPLSRAAAPAGARLDLLVLPLDAGLRLRGPATASFPLPTREEDTTGARIGIVTSAEPGLRRLRCNLYTAGTLLQSRLITVDVRARLARRACALRVEVDFNVSSTLQTDFLSGLRPVDFSLFLNTSDGGQTHDLICRGDNECRMFESKFTLDGGSVAHTTAAVRKRLREISWGTPEPWNGENPRYETTPPEADFFTDIIALARCGYRLWGALFPQLAEGAGMAGVQRRELRAFARLPLSIELACKNALRMALPISLLYDNVHDDSSAQEICPCFADGYRAGVDLVGHRCFQGDCPSQNDEQLVCPSGFWGLRHRISVVRSVTPADNDSGTTVGALRGDKPSAAVSVMPITSHPIGLAASTTDIRFRRRETHLDAMKAVFDGHLTVGESRRRVLDDLASTDAQVVYFFCHGIATPNGYPGLVVGPQDGPPITEDNLGERIRWRAHRPLVFLNGCETAALEADNIFGLVNTLVQECGAAGVIGTETTVFENTATRFAESFHDNFVHRKLPVGEAIRTARLRLLSEGNPLGLLYTTYAPVSLHLAAASQTLSR